MSEARKIKLKSKLSENCANGGEWQGECGCEVEGIDGDNAADWTGEKDGVNKVSGSGKIEKLIVFKTNCF
jgi:hypothetical protein